MAACFNCRTYVSLYDDKCPYCGSIFRPGSWQTATDLVEPADGGWGFSAKTLRGRVFAVTCLAVPLWVPLVLGLLLGRQPGGAFGILLLLALFIFIPGVYVIANLPRWPGSIRLIACLAYVFLAEVAAFLVLSWVDWIWRNVTLL
ncbi:hypothetical protein M4R22_22030 [Acidovorax sp. GBBC 3334]|uniref:hypothetical protein n=1 Tax=Acidovorax sp. GBBC 3334 TaxID=2940496 RepID=UPI0023047E0E|nr:hypothetical protein [Acidovorax sp. GBBC 3334]MDA8457449.1 hypothetical protein [Acidovorax sp. GBBC 3334]